MPRRRAWHIGGQVVSAADVRRWMQSVAARVPARSWHAYVRDWDVPGKIAREKAAGTLEQTIAEAAARASVTVRAARRPGRIAALRAAWPTAANDDTVQLLEAELELEVQKTVGWTQVRAFAIAKPPARSGRRFWSRLEALGSIRPRARSPPRIFPARAAGARCGLAVLRFQGLGKGPVTV